jgi:hypothetical protein
MAPFKSERAIGFQKMVVGLANVGPSDAPDCAPGNVFMLRMGVKLISFRQLMNRFFLRCLAVVVLGWLASAPVAWADPAIEKLELCVRNATTKNDGLAMVKWQFSMMAAHPQLRNLVTITDEQRIVFDQDIANLFTRLLTSDCLQELTDAKKTNADALEKLIFAFSISASEEIYNNPAVSAMSGGFTKYLDISKFDAVFR